MQCDQHQQYMRAQQWFVQFLTMRNAYLATLMSFEHSSQFHQALGLGAKRTFSSIFFYIYYMKHSIVFYLNFRLMSSQNKINFKIFAIERKYFYCTSKFKSRFSLVFCYNYFLRIILHQLVVNTKLAHLIPIHQELSMNLAYMCFLYFSKNYIYKAYMQRLLGQFGNFFFHLKNDISFKRCVNILKGFFPPFYVSDSK